MRHVAGLCECGVEHQPRERAVLCVVCKQRTFAYDSICAFCWPDEVEENGADDAYEAREQAHMEGAA